MRIVLGLAALVIVLATVAQLVKSQLGSLSVTGALPPPASAPGGGRAAPPLADDVRRAIDAGAAARASEAQR